MDRARCFELIESAREGVDDAAPSADGDELRAVLEPLDDEDLLGFVAAFGAELARLNRWTVREAGYVAKGGMSEDAFHDFRAWLVGKGSAAVDAAIDDPDSLADVLGDADDLGNAALEDAALDLVDERGLVDPRADEDAAPADGDPEGEPFDPETADERLPRLAAWRDRPRG